MIDGAAVTLSPGDAAGLRAGPRPPMRVELVSAAKAAGFDAEWRALIASALDEAPFLAPEFLLPAVNHAAGDPPELAAVWEEDGAGKRLAGLFPLASGAGSAEVWARPRHATLWRHPLQPFALPLLAGPMERGRLAVGAFLDWLVEQPALAGFEAAALPVGSAAAELLSEAARVRGLSVAVRREADRTRGLHFKPRGLSGAVDRVSVATEAAALNAALERLLCLDREEAPSEAILLRDPLLPALLRAAVRGFGRGGRAAVATAAEADAHAGALILIGRDRGYLWRLFGPDSSDPAVEAALAVAAERRIGLPIVSASVRPLAGAGSEAMPTESLTIGLLAQPAGVFARMRVWLGSGLFGLT